jgi:hypothetical protein
MRLVGLTVDLPSPLQFVPLDLSEGLPANGGGGWLAPQAGLGPT